MKIWPNKMKWQTETKNSGKKIFKHKIIEAKLGLDFNFLSESRGLLSHFFSSLC